MTPLFPFLLELIADWQLIKAGKKDIPLWLRVILIGLCSSETFWVLTIPVSNLCLACAPFFFFDNLLAWLRKGIEPVFENPEFGGVTYNGQFYTNYSNVGYTFLKPIESYKTLWESINGPGAWDLNPLVWRVETKPFSKDNE